MPRRKPAPPASQHLRRSIANAAARLMAEDGIGDYGFAKRKAARNLGVADGESLPTNGEVESELRAYQAIYQEDEQRERLHQLRGAALAAMRELDQFNPYLTGAVLDGTAGRYSEVELDLYADSAKDVEIWLLSNGISYEVAENKRQGHDAPEAQLRVEWDDAPILLSIYPFAAERQQRRSPHNGRQHARARPEAVAALLSQGDPET